MASEHPAIRAIVIPHDGRDAIYETLIPVPDGGLAALEESVEGESESVTRRGLPGVVAFFNEDADRTNRPLNVRATILMQEGLPVGGRLCGTVVLTGGGEEGGIFDLPSEVTAAHVAVVVGLSSLPQVPR